MGSHGCGRVISGYSRVGPKDLGLTRRVCPSTQHAVVLTRVPKFGCYVSLACVWGRRAVCRHRSAARLPSSRRIEKALGPSRRTGPGTPCPPILLGRQPRPWPTGSAPSFHRIDERSVGSASAGAERPRVGSGRVRGPMCSAVLHPAAAKEHVAKTAAATRNVRDKDHILAKITLPTLDISHQWRAEAMRAAEWRFVLGSSGRRVRSAGVLRAGAAANGVGGS
jgi:hypothetical protein